MSVEFSLDYEAAEAMVNKLGEAVQFYGRIMGQLAQVGVELNTQHFVGLTGQAAMNYMMQVQSHVSQMMGKTIEMQTDLMQTIAEFRGDIDPGMAQRFQD